MSDITVCDICNKPLDGKKHRRFKVKELKDAVLGFQWQRIDVHDECIRKLMNAAGKEEQHD